MEKPKKIVITGGAGYIGSVLTNLALARGFEVNVFDSALQDPLISKGLINSRLRYYQGNITDKEVLKESLDGVDYVIHLAGVSDGKAGKANPELTRKINVEPLEQLLQISKSSGVQKFIFASTMGVYGNKYTLPLTESLELKPIDPYSESKAIGEEIIKSENTPKFSTTILRMAMVYGVSPKMRFDFIVNRLTLDAIQNNKITITGGAQKRPQIHIDDLSELFLFLLRDAHLPLVSGQCFNAVENNPTINDMANRLLEAFPGLIVEKLPARENEDDFEMDGNKLLSVTGFQYKKNLAIGIKEIIEKYSPHNSLI